GPRLHRVRPGVPRRTARLPSRVESGDRRGDAVAQRRGARRAGDQAGELGRVRVVDARLLAGTDRGPPCLRRAGWETEVVRLEPVRLEPGPAKAGHYYVLSGPAKAARYVLSGPAQAARYVLSGPAQAGHYVLSGPAQAGHYVLSG